MRRVTVTTEGSVRGLTLANAAGNHEDCPYVVTAERCSGTLPGFGVSPRFSLLLVPQEWGPGG